MKRYLFFVVISLVPLIVSAQMVVGTDTLYGNEWIDYSQSYYKIPVARDGIYRLSATELAAAGVPVSQVPASAYRLYHLGKEVPLFSVSDAPLSTGDYLEFYGSKNRTELEEHLFSNPGAMLHPGYSLFTDTSAYFLTWSDTGTGLRYQNEANDTLNHPAKEPWFWHQLDLNFTDYWAKHELNDGAKFSRFDIQEGFSTTLKTDQTHSFEPTNPAAGPDATLHFRYAGRGSDHHFEIRINNDLQLVDEYSGWNVRDFSFPVPNADLNAPVVLKITGLPNSSNQIDRSRVGMVSLKYPHSFDLEGKSMFLLDLPGTGAKYLEVENFDSSSGPPVLYDVRNGRRWVAKMKGSVACFNLPALAQAGRFVLVAQPYTAPAITPVNFLDYSGANSDYLIISESRLMDDGSGHNYVQDYADYRASAAGGSYSPLVVDIEQVYDQFGYGIRRNPIALRNMVHWAAKNWDNERFLFIIGKGRPYSDLRTAAQMAAAQETFLVPTFGSPGGDQLFVTSNFDPSPVMAVGRLAAKSPEEVRIYLKKVKDLEYNQHDYTPATIDHLAWKKQILHLGGGSDAALQQDIKNRLKHLEKIISNNAFGAKVHSFFRAGTDPIQQSNSQAIFDLVNHGVGLITFFGHSSTGSLDLDIDNPEKYNNQGKYPLIISMGCYSGDIFSSQTGISERFVFYEDKAGIGMLATSGVGFVTALDQFVRRLYADLGTSHYLQSIGEALMEVKDHFKDDQGGVGLLVDQYTLHADPAIRFTFAQGPDYVFDASAVHFQTDVIDTQSDSFAVNLRIVNLGKAIQDSLTVEVMHLLPDNQVASVKMIRILAPKFDTLIAVQFSNPGKTAVGRNTLRAVLDPANAIDEWSLPDAELNNRLLSPTGQEGVQFFIFDNSALPVYPYEFAIVSSPPELIASTTNPLAQNKTYVFELDVTEEFDSPQKQTFSLTQSGGLLKWSPPGPWQDSTVYYWRISPDSTGPEDSYIWSHSSFVYLSGSAPGWNQSDYYQYAHNQPAGIVADEETKQLQFVPDFRDGKIINFVPSGPLRPYYYNNGQAWWGPFFWPINEGVEVLVFDSLTGLYWSNIISPDKVGKYGSVCLPTIPNPTWSYIAFAFPTGTLEERQTLLSFLRDTIPDKNYVFFSTLMRYPTSDFHPEDWAVDSVTLGTNLFAFLESNGAQNVRQLEQTGSRPYSFVFRKGVAPLDESLADSVGGTALVEAAIQGRWFEGAFKSVPVGPAKEWHHLEWKPDLMPGDSAHLSLWGLGPADTVLLIQNFTGSDTVLTGIDAAQFPYLQLEVFAQDLAGRTPPPLDFLRVRYTPVADAAINPNAQWTFHADTLTQGEQLTLQTVVENVSGYDLDSMQVTVALKDQNNQTTQYQQFIRPLPAKDTAHVHFVLPTTSLAGKSGLLLEVNPPDNPREQFHFNNLLVKNFEVAADHQKPVLDVTFDGIRIMDGDLVSASPDILITLDDENEYFKLEDTSLVILRLTEPGGIPKRIYFSAPELEFEPATGEKNIAKVHFTPSLVQDGTYQLEVEARDATGNQAGDYTYKISFEVINESMVSNVFVYPNPFSTSARFAYTLTGSEPPEVFTIRIMTVDGRVVREITRDELGDLRIGKHLTDFVWDGTDEYGDRLANGVYIYQVIVKKDGETIKKYNTGTDRFFKNNFGKLVIMR